MADGSITINSNTLLKLLIRRGLNSERLNVVLTQGELGFTTDNKKLYIGDGSTLGGIQVTGTKFYGIAGDITTFAPADINDLAFDADAFTLYAVTANDGSQQTDWTPIGGVYRSGTDTTITVNADNTIVLGNAAGQSLAKNAGNQLTLASTIYTDNIQPQASATSWLTLPQRTAVGAVNYTWPAGGSANNYLKLNSGGQLTWEAIGSTANTFVNSDIVPVGTIIPYASTTLPSNNRFLYCDGSYVLNTSYPVLCATLTTSFGALSTNGGSTYFKLPDLRGKVPFGYTNTQVTDLSGNGYTLTFATAGGRLKTMLSADHIPQHYHYTVANIMQTGLGPAIPSRQLLSAAQAVARSNDGQGVSTWEYNLVGTSLDPTIGRTSTYGTLSTLQSPVMTLPPYTVVNYIIKAIPDPIALCNITVQNGITAFDNTLGSATSNINPLSSTYNIGLNSIIAPRDFGQFTVDNTGRVTSYNTTSAGSVGVSQPQTTATTHGFAYHNFLYTPVEVASDTITTGQPSWCGPVIVYPQIKNINGTNATPTAAIPAVAKNVVVDVFVDFYSASNPVGIYGAMNTSLMNASTATLARGATEYNVAYVQSGANNSRSSAASQQLVLPLSANANNNNMSFALRGLNMNGTYSVRVIGWTL